MRARRAGFITAREYSVAGSPFSAIQRGGTVIDNVPRGPRTFLLPT